MVPFVVFLCIDTIYCGILDLFWVGEQDGELPPAGMAAVYVGNNEVARAWFGQDLVGGKTYRGNFEAASDGAALLLPGGYEVLKALFPRHLHPILFSKSS